MKPLQITVADAPHIFALDVPPFRLGDPRPAIALTLQVGDAVGRAEDVGWPGRQAPPTPAATRAAAEALRGLPLDADGLHAAPARLADAPPSAAWAAVAAFTALVTAAGGAAPAPAVETAGLRFDLEPAVGLDGAPRPLGRHLKVKVDPSTDATALARLAADHAPRTLRLDGNHRLDLDAACALAAAAGPALEWLEEPVPREHLAPLGREAPLALDESLAVGTLDDAARLVDATHPRVLVLKPAVLGPARTFALARLAAARGLPVAVSALFEGLHGLCALAALHAALSQNAGTTVAAGLGTGRFLVGQDRVRLDADGRAWLPTSADFQGSPR